MNKSEPYIIDFEKHGDTDIGFISVGGRKEGIPFDIKRTFWTYETPDMIVRGRHALIDTEQVLIALAGRILVTTESTTGKIKTWVLDRPDIGLYLPSSYWRTMQYGKNSIQLVVASSDFDESKYIRDYNDFINKK